MRSLDTRVSRLEASAPPPPPAPCPECRYPEVRALGATFYVDDPRKECSRCGRRLDAFGRPLCDHVMIIELDRTREQAAARPAGSIPIAEWETAAWL